MTYIDLVARECTLESGIQNKDIAILFSNYPDFDVFIKNDLVKFKDRTSGRVFFATIYAEFYRNGDYIRVDNPICINIWCKGSVTYKGESILHPGLTVERKWKDETPPSKED